MNSPFELQIEFKNDCNWTNVFFVEFKIPRHIWLHRRRSKNRSNLHKNSIISKRYIISKEIVIENYKRCLKRQFLFFVQHKYKPHAWHLRSELSFLPIITSHSLLLKLGHAGWDFSRPRWFMRLLLCENPCKFTY